MTWTWRLEAGDGTVRGESEAFESQSDAETWIGLEFGDLLERGIDQVVLLDDGAESYTMNLHP